MVNTRSGRLPRLRRLASTNLPPPYREEAPSQVSQRSTSLPRERATSLPPQFSFDTSDLMSGPAYGPLNENEAGPIPDAPSVGPAEHALNRLRHGQRVPLSFYRAAVATYGKSFVTSVTHPGLKTRKRKTTRRKTTTRKRKVYRRALGGGRYRATGSSRVSPIIIQGRGGYWTDKLKTGLKAGYKSFGRLLPQGSFERIGTAIGGSVGAGPGAAWGGMAGRYVSQLAGFGAYNVNRNALMLDEGEPVPSFGNLSQATIVCHREYIKDIVGPAVGATFTLDSFPVNPRNPETFPWLSQIAQMYDQYEVLGMIFEYKSTSQDSVNTGVGLGMGTVIMASDYDPADNDYASKIEMENSQYCITTKPNQDAIHPIECDPSYGQTAIKYTRGVSVPAGKDIRLYDHCNFQIATVGLPNTAGSIGELWCSYKVALYKPQFAVQGASAITDGFSIPGAGITSADKMLAGRAAPIAADIGSSIGGTITAANTYTFPAYIQSGTYLVTYIMQGAITALTTSFTWTSTNIISPSVLGNDTYGTIIWYPAASTQSVAGGQVIVTVTGSPATITINSGSVCNNNGGAGNFIVASLDRNAF